MVSKSNINIFKIVTTFAFSSYLFSQTVSFTPAGQGTDYMRYNVATAAANNSGGLSGGFTMTGSSFDDLNMYIIEFSFDGTTWNSDVSAMVATTGALVAGGNGGRFTSIGGNAQISISHAVFSAVSTWPGNDGTIVLRVNESGTANYYPTNAGITWPLDLTRPTINTASITSNNGTNTGYATTDDVITLSITASEDLMNAGDYVFTGDISGLNFITQTGANDATWSFNSTVTTHAEQVVTFEVVYYDANYNRGTASLTQTTDGSTVIVDRTPPVVNVSIASNNSVTSLAKEGDAVTLTIASEEVLNGPPTVQLSTETSPTISPSGQTSDYTATYSPTTAAGDPENTPLTFSVSNIKDRAGNTISAITETFDASSVTFDNTAPIVTIVSQFSNNTISSGTRAKADDEVTIYFDSDEQVQTPVVLIDGEAATESDRNNNNDKLTWAAVKIMDAEDTDSADDTDYIDFTINYTDLAGNAGTVKTQANLTNAGVVFDNTPPNEPTVTVASSNSVNSNYAIGGNIVSLAITCNENLLDDTDGDGNPDGITNAVIAGRVVNNIGVETVTRNSGTNWAAQVQLTGSEDNEPVTYAFTMTDLTGNTRTVTANTSNITIDNAAPSISPISIVSNGDNPLFAKPGDIVTLSFTSNENLSGVTGHTPDATIASVSATPVLTTGDAADRTAFASTYTTLNSTSEGLMSFTLDVEDVAGNSVSSTATTDGTSVTFDKTLPTATYVRMASNGDDATYAKPGDVVTLTMRSDDLLNADPTFTIFTKTINEAANPIIVQGSNVDQIWTAQYTLPAGLDDGTGSVEVPFTLSFTDKAGNDVASTITALVDDADGVVTYDEIVPTLNAVTITSSNGDPTLAKVGDVITLSVTASENIKRPTIIIAGRTGDGAATLTDATNSDGRRIYQATYTMLTGDNEGIIAFSVDFEDLASNAGTQVVALTADDTDGAVTFDKTPPLFTGTNADGTGSVSIASNNSNGVTDVAIVGDQVKLTITSTENIKTGTLPTVTIAGNAASVSRVPANQDKIFEATYSMSTVSDGTDNIASIPFQIVAGYMDAAGNEGVLVNTTTDGSSVKYDPVAPTLTNVQMVSSGDNTAYAKVDDVITLTFNSSETLKFTDVDGDGIVDPDASEPLISILGSTDNITITQAQADSWQAVKTVTNSHAETEVAFSIIYGDPAGNTGASAITAVQTGTAVTVDRTSPTITKIDVKTDNSIDSAFAVPDNEVIITIKADEGIQAPTVTTSHSVASTVTNVDGGINRKWEARHIAGDFEDVGLMTFQVSLSDYAGNGPVTSTDLLADFDGNGVTYDNTAPTLQDVIFTSNNGVNNQYAKVGDIVTVSFNATEQLLASSVVVTIDADGDGAIDADEGATESKVSAFANGLEPWTASYEIQPTMDDNNGAGFDIPFMIDFNDIFTVPGVRVTQGVETITFDKTPPVLTAFTVSSNNGGLPTLATTGDQITINITGNEKLAFTSGNDPETIFPTITLDGNQVNLTSVAGTGDLSWEGTYTVPSTLTEGVIPLVMNYRDYANNSGITLTEDDLTDAQTITFDKTAPTLTSVSISSNNSYNSTMAKVGDIVTISFTGSHPLNASPIVKVDGENLATVSQGADATTWSAAYEMTDANNEGAIVFTIDYADLATNAGVQKSQADVTDASSITFDKSPTVVTSYTVALDPNSDSGQSNNDNYTNDTTPTYNISGLTTGDAVADATNDWLILFINGIRSDSTQVSSDDASVTIGIDRALDNSPAPYEITFKTRDLAGNLSEATEALELIIDTEVPSAGDILDLKAAFDTGVSSLDNITISTVPTFTISGLEQRRLSDINLYYDRANASVSDTFLLSHTMTQPVSDDIQIPNSLSLSEDVYTFWYTVGDSAGNVSLNSGTIEVTIDLTPPTTSVAPDLLHEGNGVNDFDSGTSSSDNITNLETVKFRVTGLSTDDNSVILVDTGNDNDASNDSDVVEATIDGAVVDLTVTSLATTTYAAKVTDAAGNESILSETISVTFDNTPTDIDGYDDPINGTQGNYSEALYNEYPPVTIDLTGISDTGSDTTDHITKETLPSFRIKNLAVTDSIFLFATVAGNPDNLVAKAVADNSTEVLTVRDGSLPSHVLLALTQNDYEIKLRTKDVAGNVSAFTTFFLNENGFYEQGINLSVDTTPFTIVSDPDMVDADDTGVSDSDNVTSNRTPQFQFLNLDPSADSLELYQTNQAGVTSFTRGGFKTDGEFDFTLAVPSELIAGTYDFKFRVIDIAGNESSYSNVVSVTIDYTAPSDPVNLDLLSSDDNGPLDTDNLTNATNMTLTASGFTSGEYGYLYSYDGPGDINPGDDVLVSFVQLNNDDLGVASFSVDNNASALTNYYVIAQDVAGNASTIASAPNLAVNVDLDSPVVDDITITLDPNSDTGISGDNAGFNTTPTFIVTDSESGLTATDSVILFYALKPNSQDPGNGLNGIPKRLAALPIDASTENLISSGFDENADGTPDDGSYAITAKIRDFAGNLSTASQEIVYRLDTQAPAPPGDLDSLDLLAAFDSGFSEEDNYTNNTGPQFKVNGLEPFKRDSVKLYAQKGFTNFYVSGSVAGDDPPEATLITWTDIADGDGVLNGVFDDGEGFELTEGSWILTYTLKDSAGNETSVRNSLDVTIDLTSPAAPEVSNLPSAFDTGVLSNDNLTNLSDLRITLKGLVSLDIGELYLYDGDGGFDVTQDTRIDSALFDSDSLFFEPTGLNSGINEFYSASIDRAGNQSGLSPGLQVTVDLDPPTVDNITITLDPDSDTGILLDNAGFNTAPTFTVSDPVSGLTPTDSLVLFYALRPNSLDPGNGLNGVAKRYASLVIDNAISQSMTGVGFDENQDGNIDDGSYTISARVKDYAGNFSSPAEVLVYRLDTQAPIFWDEDLNQLDPNSSFLAPDLMTENDNGYSSTDNITNSQNPSFIFNNMHPFLKDQVTLFARKGFTTTTVGSGFVSSLQTSDTLTVPWVDANGNDAPDDGEGFALDNGTWSITYTVTDSAGNIAPESPPLIVEVDAIAPPSLGLPDLLTEFDTGESSEDNLTNLGTVRLGQTDTIPGFKWVLFSAIDDGDGVYDENLDLNIVPLDSNLFPGGQGDDGLDLNGDGVPDGARSISSDIQVDLDPVYHFFSVQEDIAGNRSGNSEVLTVGVDFVSPTCIITYDDPDGDGQADNLVKSLDGTLKATFTFDKSIDDQDNPPVVIVDYPGNFFPSDTVQLTKQNLANDLIWEYSIPLNESGMDSLNGILNLLLTASDRYGNPVETISGNSDIRIDNLPATFTNIIPGSNSYTNLDSILEWSWNLEEPNEGTEIVSASISFNQNDGTSINVTLSNDDLIEGDRASNILPGWDADGVGIDEGEYEVIFSSLDFAGNEGSDTLFNFVYDTTSPTASISFSRLYADDGDTVIFNIVFSENMLFDPLNLPTLTADLPGPGLTTSGPLQRSNPPETFIDDGGDGILGNGDIGDSNGQWDEGETILNDNGDGIYDPIGDLVNFKYIFIPGDGGIGTDQHGELSNFQFGNTKDLADNDVNSQIDFDSNDDGVDEILSLDNIDGVASFIYQNITNPSLTNVGIAGDTIRVVVTTSEKVKQTSPVPTIGFIYNSLTDTQGDTVLALNLAEANTDSITWIFDVILADSVFNDGIMNFNFNGNDLAENPLESFQSNQIFAVDNLPPNYYETGEVRINGGNPVQGWITGNTTSIVCTVFIENFDIDSTLVNGEVEIQFYNQSRGQGWQTIGINSPIEDNNGNFDFSRSIEDLYAVFDTTSTGVNGLQPGDLLEVRAKVIDKHANATAFGTSPTTLKYDPSGPIAGVIVSGVFGTTSDSSTYTILSSDQVDISWTPFLESDPDESGMQQYAFSILKKDSTTTPPGNMDAFFDTVLTATINPLQPDTFFSKELFLRHNTKYIAQIVGIDTAGNYSDTLKSDTLLRLNSAPIISNIISQFIDEDLSWNYSVEITDPDINVLQGDSHIYAIDSTSIDSAFTATGIVRGGTYRDVFLDWGASRQDSYYAGCIIEIGTAEDKQVRTILAYDGATRTATVSDGTSDLSPTPAEGIGYNIRFSVPVIDSLTGVMSWTPRQTNIGQADIFVTVTDEYSLADTLTVQLEVRSVNDRPESILGDSLSVVEWEEDTTTTITLSKYFFDVDNGIMVNDGFRWNVVILDTAELDEDFPLGIVIPGPGTSNELHAKIAREYIGFDPSLNFTSQNLTSQRVQQLNEVSRNPLLDVQISEVDFNGDGIMDSTEALFISDSNYYGSGHSIIFIGTDYSCDESLYQNDYEDCVDSQVRDTITAVITAKNDPPKLDSIPDQVMYENDSLWLKFGPYASDVDNETLTFTVSALTNDDKISIQPMGTNQENLVSSSIEDSIRFIPTPLWSNEAVIQVVVDDGNASDTSSFTLDIERVLRPHFSVTVTQNNAFNKYFQITVIDTVEKATFVSLDVANSQRNIEEIADYTYVAYVYMESSGNYPIDVSANAAVGDTTIREYFSLAAGRAASRWSGQSFDGRFSVVGNPGAISYDQSLLIIDSTLFDRSFYDRASYVLGDEDFEFNQPIEVRMAHEKDDVAIYRRKSGLIWEELPSINKDGEIFTLSEKAGYFKLGPKTIIVPEQTSIHQNYPNPFNPTTTIMYDIGLLDGLKQRVSLNVYNLLGQHITTLVENKDQIGQFKVQWNGTDKFGQQMSSGVYFIQLSTETGIVRNKKMMLLK